MSALDVEKCIKCGGEPTVAVDVEIDGETAPIRRLCGPCIDKAIADHAKWKAEFERMLAAGIDPRMANRILIERMNRDEPAEGAPKAMEITLYSSYSSPVYARQLHRRRTRRERKRLRALGRLPGLVEFIERENGLDVRVPPIILINNVKHGLRMRVVENALNAYIAGRG